jgi:methylmalonyl-CoA mutase cobalamin-binding domain/chain
VLGGTQSLHTNSFDEALALPTEEAARLALRTQQVIAHESGAVNAIDPLGGSYHVERLTNTLETQAYEYFDRIDRLGGVVAAIKENFFQREIAEASFRYQSEVESGKRVIVGVNRYVLDDEQPIPILKIDPALERKQIDRLGGVKAGRDGAKVEQAEMELFPREYQLPGLGLLADPPGTPWEMSDDEKEKLSRKIEQALAEVEVEVEVIEVIQGPVITRFALRVAGAGRP